MKKCQPKQPLKRRRLLVLHTNKFICWCDKVTLGLFFFFFLSQLLYDDLLHCLRFQMFDFDSILVLFGFSKWPAKMPNIRHSHHLVTFYIGMRLFVVSKTHISFCVIFVAIQSVVTQNWYPNRVCGIQVFHLVDRCFYLIILFWQVFLFTTTLICVTFYSENRLHFRRLVFVCLLFFIIAFRTYFSLCHLFFFFVLISFWYYHW